MRWPRADSIQTFIYICFWICIAWTWGIIIKEEHSLSHVWSNVVVLCSSWKLIWAWWWILESCWRNIIVQESAVKLVEKWCETMNRVFERLYIYFLISCYNDYTSFLLFALHLRKVVATPHRKEGGFMCISWRCIPRQRSPSATTPFLEPLWNVHEWLIIELYVNVYSILQNMRATRSCYKAQLKFIYFLTIKNLLKVLD